MGLPWRAVHGINVWNLENILSFCMWALGAPLVPVCIVLAVLNPNRRPCACFGRGEKKQKKISHLALYF